MIKIPRLRPDRRAAPARDSPGFGAIHPRAGRGDYLFPRLKGAPKKRAPESDEMLSVSNF